MNELKLFCMVWEGRPFTDTVGLDFSKRPLLVEHVSYTLEEAIDAAKHFLKIKYPLDSDWKLVKASILQYNTVVTELEIPQD